MLFNVEFGKWYWKRGTATYKQTVHLKESIEHTWQFLHAHLVIATENVSIDMMPLDIRLLYLETTRFCTAISKQSSRPD